MERVAEYVIIFLFTIFLKTEGKFVYVSPSTCNNSYNVNQVGDVYLKLSEKLYSECQINMEKNKGYDSDNPRLCIKPEVMNFGGCGINIQIHNIMFIDGYHDKEYSCTSGRETYCAYVDKFVIVFKPDTLRSYASYYLQLKVYREKSEYDSSWVIVVGVLVSVSVITFVVLIVVCRTRGQRALMSASSPYRPTQPQFTPYPTVQYQTTPQQAVNYHSGAGYQPGTAGYQPPVSGYQPTGTGYPVNTGQNFQSGYHPSGHSATPLGKLNIVESIDHTSTTLELSLPSVTKHCMTPVPTLSESSTTEQPEYVTLPALHI